MEAAIPTSPTIEKLLHDLDQRNKKLRLFSSVVSLLIKYSPMPIPPEVQAALQGVSDAISTEATEVSTNVQNLADAIRSGAITDTSEIVAAIEAFVPRIQGFSDLVKDPGAPPAP